MNGKTAVANSPIVVGNRHVRSEAVIEHWRLCFFSN